MKHRIFNQFDNVFPEIRIFDGNIMYTQEKLNDKVT